MADEELAIASPALETPASEETTVETPEIETEEELETPEGPDDEGEEETDELEFAFKKYAVPKSLKEAVEALRADATRKTQDASAKAKALEARAAEIEESSKVSDEEIDLKAELKAIDKTLSEYQKLTQADWDHHYATDYVAADRAWRQMQVLKEQRNGVAQNLEGKAKQRTETAQSELTKRIQETLEHASKSTIGLKPDSIPKLVEFAQQLGVPDATIQKNWSPTFADLLHYARIGKMASEKQKSPAKVTAPTEAPKPVTPISSKGQAPKLGLRDDLSIEEWTRRREAQLKKRA